MLTTSPPRSPNASIAARMPHRVPSRLTSTSRRTCSSDRSTSVPSSPTPALLNHARSTPWRAAAAATSRCDAGSPTSWRSPSAAPISLAVARRRVAVDVGEHDPVAARDHPLGDAAADAAGCSGDDARCCSWAGVNARRPAFGSGVSRLRRLGRLAPQPPVERDTRFEQVFEFTPSRGLRCGHQHHDGTATGRRHHGQQDRQRAARRTAGRHRADPAPAAGAGQHIKDAIEKRGLPAQHARDRRGGRADQLLQRRPPAQGARGEGLPQARPQPAAGARGVPARGDGRPPLARLGRGVRRSTRPASATPLPRRRTSRCSAGSPPVARSWPRRTSRRSSRCPRPWSARASCSCSRCAATRWSTPRSATATTS